MYYKDQQPLVKTFLAGFYFTGLYMQRSFIPSLVGVAVSLVIVWFLHGFLLADSCLDNGGAFDYSTNLCVGTNGDVIAQPLNNTMIVLYCVVIMVTSLLVTNVIRKALCKFQN